MKKGSHEKMVKRANHVILDCLFSTQAWINDRSVRKEYSLGTLNQRPVQSYSNLFVRSTGTLKK